MAQAEREMDAFTELASRLRQPRYLFFVAEWEAARALRDGRLDEAEGLIQKALAAGQKAQYPSAVLGFGLKLGQLRFMQGRSLEMTGPQEAFAAQYPNIPGWRAALAVLYWETGRREDARREFEKLAARDFVDIPRDALFLSCLTFLAYVCQRLGDVRRARLLHELLEPFAGHYAWIYDTVCYGAVIGFLGSLAAMMGRWKEAIAQSEAAIEANARSGLVTYEARFRGEYARTLLARGRSGDREKALELVEQALGRSRELEIKAWVDACLELKREARDVDVRDTHPTGPKAPS
jgi:tetratricopeptide (TPR) repeat protein